MPTPIGRASAFPPSRNGKKPREAKAKAFILGVMKTSRSGLIQELISPPIPKLVERRMAVSVTP